MNKKGFIILLLLVICWGSYGQNQITRNNGDLINCKIISIDTSKIIMLISRSGKNIKSYIYINDISNFTYNGQLYDISSIKNIDLNNIIQINNYNSDLIFELDKIEKWNFIYTGNGYYYTPKGTTFFMIYMTIQNTSQLKQVINFEEFKIIDVESNYKFQLEKVLAKGFINIFYKKNKKINPASSIEVKLAYVCPENFIPKKILVKDVLFDIPHGIIKD